MILIGGVHDAALNERISISLSVTIISRMPRVKGKESSRRSRTRVECGVRQAWMDNVGCKSLLEPVGGNQEPEATARDGDSFRTTEVFPARACGVEARGLPLYRTQVKPRKAVLSG